MNTRRSLLGSWVLVLLAFLTGCTEQVREEYGHRSQDNSVNGVSVLSECFDQAGHRVRSWRRLSPSLEKADVIVWFPDRFQTPSAEVVEWLQDWLQYDPRGVQLIIVGRDYSAGKDYWKTVAPKARQQDKLIVKEKADRATREFNLRRKNLPTDELIEDWFVVDGTTKPYPVKGLAGPWATGVDASKANIVSGKVYEPVDTFDILLEDDQGHPLVSQLIYSADDTDWAEDDSRLILVENGSFLLNAALVNHEHRKLAIKLVNSVGTEDKRVVFLESGPLDPLISEDPTSEPPVGFLLFSIWPIGAVLAQLAAMGVVFSIMRWPIFGVPRQLEQPELTNFRRHIRAIGALLADAEDRSYAFRQIAGYFRKETVQKSPQTEKPEAAPNPDSTSPQSQGSQTTGTVAPPIDTKDR